MILSIIEETIHESYFVKKSHIDSYHLNDFLRHHNIYHLIFNLDVSRSILHIESIQRTEAFNILYITLAIGFF